MLRQMRGGKDASQLRRQFPLFFLVLCLCTQYFIQTCLLQAFTFVVLLLIKETPSCLYSA